MNLDTMTTEQLEDLRTELYDAITAKLPKHVYRNRNGFKVQIGAEYYGTFPSAAQAIDHLANVTKRLRPFQTPSWMPTPATFTNNHIH